MASQRAEWRAARGGIATIWLLAAMVAPKSEAFVPATLLSTPQMRLSAAITVVKRGPPRFHWEAQPCRGHLLRMAAAESAVGSKTASGGFSGSEGFGGFTAAADVKEVDTMAVLRLMMPRTRALQLRALLSLSLLLVSRAANVMIPLSFKGLVDNLSLLGGGKMVGASAAASAVDLALTFMALFVGWKLLQVRSTSLHLLS